MAKGAVSILAISAKILSQYQALEQQLHSSREALITYAQEIQQHERRSRQLEEKMDKYRAELTGYDSST